MKTIYNVIEKKDFTESHRDILANMLEQQGKVQEDLSGGFSKKIDRCKFICAVSVDDDIAAIGATKQKTASDFSHQKAGLPNLANEFEWELGYFYTVDKYKGNGIGSMIAKLLIKKHGKGNLMASTEITANPAMVNILRKNGFRQFGKPWKSSIHGDYLGLFLKFA